MTLDELREREQQVRARLGVGCENPAAWTIEAFDADGQVEAEHVVDGICLTIDSHGISVSLDPGYRDGEALQGFIPAATLVEMFKELRAAIGPTAFEEIYGGIGDGSH